ncbi:phospholipid/glycerol acyltransferase, partial [Pseudomonas syringae pv. japonica str. M301072]
TKQLAIEMDRQILGGYRLFPVHYLAYAQWSDADPALEVPKAEALFPADELERAREEWESRLAGTPIEHRPYMIQQYATPVRNQYRVKAGLAL